MRRPSVYKAIVRARVRRLWQRINEGDYEAAVKMAAPGLRFGFLAPETPLEADVRALKRFGRGSLASSTCSQGSRSR
jgi:hypothetical protein